MAEIVVIGGGSSGSRRRCSSRGDGHEVTVLERDPVRLHPPTPDAAWASLGPYRGQPVPHAPLLPPPFPDHAGGRAARRRPGRSRRSVRCGSAARRRRRRGHRRPSATATTASAPSPAADRWSRPRLARAAGGDRRADHPAGRRDRRAARRRTPSSPIRRTWSGCAPTRATSSPPISWSTRRGAGRNLPARLAAGRGATGRRGARGLRLRVLRPPLPVGRRERPGEPRPAPPALRLGVGAHAPGRQRHVGSRHHRLGTRRADARSATAHWEAMWRSFPLVAHWLDAGQPISEGVAIMAKIEDRHRSFLVDGEPVAHRGGGRGRRVGVHQPVGRAGSSIGLLHAVALRDLFRRCPTIPSRSGRAWHAATVRAVEPWYRATLSYDRHRLGEIEALRAGDVYETDDEEYAITKALEFGAGERSRSPPGVPRRRLDGRRCRTEALAAPGVFEKVLAVGDGWRDEELLGPDRAGLLELVGA